MQIAFKDNNDNGEFKIWCCVPSPQSTNIQDFGSGSFTATPDTFLSLVGTPEDVPKKYSHILGIERAHAYITLIRSKLIITNNHTQANMISSKTHASQEFKGSESISIFKHW